MWTADIMKADKQQSETRGIYSSHKNAQNEAALSNHRVRRLYFQAVAFEATIFL